MEKKASLERAIEIFVLITFPIALIVGCAGTGKEKTDVEKTVDNSKIEQSYNMQDIYPLFSADADNKQAYEIITGTTDIKSIDGGVATVDSVIKNTEVSDIVINNTTPSVMKVSFVENTSQVDQEQTKNDLTMVGDTTNDVLTVGANSKMALMNDIQMQPSYLVFNFDTDTAKVREYDHLFLKQHASYLNLNPKLTLKVTGHTDSRGSRIYNEELSKRRASEIVKTLVSFGASESQIQVNSLGESTPIIDKTRLDENRRVELEYVDNTMISSK